jgi:sucrose-phosphate synthase
MALLNDSQLWRTFSENGLTNVRKYYSWQAHAGKYVNSIKPLLGQQMPLPKVARSRSSLRYQDRAIFTDIDQSLLGNPEGLLEFARYIRDKRRHVFFGIATGRRLDSALAALRKHRIPTPDVLLTSLGTEIYYAPHITADMAWARHIDHYWNPGAIRRIMSEIPGLTWQPKNEQSRFKISFYYNPDIAPSPDEINARLRQEEQVVNARLAFGQYFDIVPVRASKGLALRYFSQQWNIPLGRILVAGGSAADEDMMRGNTLAVVVANRHREELAQLDEPERIYFAQQPYALGIIEAIEHYDFFNNND